MSPTGRLHTHWPEYLAEAVGLGLFMIAAAGFASLIEHPGLPVRQAIGDAATRRVLMGLAMGATACALIYSPIGARSGAHMNPATTLAFWRLGKIAGADAGGYVLAQFAGAMAGMTVAALLFQEFIAAPEVHYVATVPGPWGSAAAFGAEVAITFVMMTVVLQLSNSRFSRVTGLAAGALVALYITFEAPISGMSLNPARSLAPALMAGEIATVWIYLLAPPLGMLLAAECFVRRHGAHAVACAKLHHHTTARCIFRCRFVEGQTDVHAL